MGFTGGRSRVAGMLGVIALASSLTAACGSDDDSAADSKADYLILGVLPTSGQLATLGASSEAGLRAAADVLNANGGIDGRTVKVEVLDDGGDPTKAVSVLTNRLSSGTKPDFVIPGTLSIETVALLPALDREGIMSGGGAVDPRLNDPDTYPYYFSTSLSAQTQATLWAQEAIKQAPTKVGALLGNDPFGETVQSAIPELFEEAGIELDVETYDPTAVDLTAQAEALKRAGVDTVMFQGNGAVVATALTAFARVGLDVPIIGDNNVSSASAAIETVDPLPDNLSVVTFQSNVEAAGDTETEGRKDFIEALDRAGGAPSPYLAGFTYDAVMVNAMAVEQAGTSDVEEVQEALENLDQPEAAERPYISLPLMEYTDESHFPVAEGDDAMVLVKWSPPVDGLLPAS